MDKQNLVEKAKELSEKIHQNRMRESGDSYFEHAVRVAQLLLKVGVEDKATLAASYLHHALDLPNSFNIQEEFGEEVFDIIRNYKELSEDKFSNISPSNIDENLIIQTYFNIAKNPKTLLIRLADKTDNIKTAHKLPKEKQKKVAERALYIYAPICKIIGLSKFVNILEDGAFKILNPSEYYKIEHYIKRNFPRIHHELDEIEKFLTEAIKEKGINGEIKTRTKSVYSTYSKLRKYTEKGQLHKVIGYKGIYDFAGIRILVETEEDCYKCENLLMDLWDQVPGTRDDYISKPKPNGYKTLQSAYIAGNNLIVEAQIRTHKMHEENEFGQASHFLYKMGEGLKKSLGGTPDFLKSVNYAINREKLEINQFSKSVYVYTPKGDIIKLPRGSNLIDFAYAVHDQLGNTAVGGEVNGEFKSLEYILQDGDMVNIKINKQKKSVDRKLLDVVKTKKAKDHIRKLLSKQE